MSSIDPPEGWPARAAALRPTLHGFVDGESYASGDRARFACINPATGAAFAELAAGTEADADHAVAAARRAFADGRWRDLPPGARRQILFGWADRIIAAGAELALLDTLCMGKPITQARFDVELAAAAIRFAAETIDKLNDDVLPTGAGSLALNLREPIGVVAAITPWNFPLAIAAMKSAAALAAGNSVVLKPSEVSPLSALMLARHAAEAGLPAGTFNVLPGLGSTIGAALARHRDVDMISFTGSTETGKAILRAVGATHMKKLSLECGGKSPCIVLADCTDLDAVADDVAMQICWNAGQVCSISTRLIVEAPIAAALAERVATRMALAVPGDPLDPANVMGPLASRAQYEKVLRYLQQGTASGARALCGGTQADPSAAGYFVHPTLFDGVDPASPIAQDEIFGPVLALLPVADADEACRVANGTMYGLAGRIWTDDLRKGYGLARRLAAGSVVVSATRPTDPGPGFAAGMEAAKQSGFGIEGGMAGIRAFTHLKAITINL
jgi:acyl-CoA reductase-like NAD-dependent aldehyde dehydrogenase